MKEFTHQSHNIRLGYALAIAYGQRRILVRLGGERFLYEKVPGNGPNGGQHVRITDAFGLKLVRHAHAQDLGISGGRTRKFTRARLGLPVLPDESVIPHIQKVVFSLRSWTGSGKTCRHASYAIIYGVEIKKKSRLFLENRNELCNHTPAQ
jgi:hypothetical protein